MAFNLNAQNYVPNWSFEDHVQCPSQFNQIQLATGWNKHLLNNVAPHHVDYFHTCGSGGFEVPGGFWGNQLPSTGQAHAAISTRSPLAPDYRENIYAQLIEPLTPGAFYTISMKVSHTDLSAGATNNLGIKLSTTTAFPIDNTDHLHATAILDDHVNWVTLTASLFADSAYAYIAVGNFHTDANTTVSTVCPSCPYVHNEYYIDDICILPHTDNGDPVFCDIAYTPSTTGFEGEAKPELTLLTNLLGPGEQIVRIQGLPGGPTDLVLMDAMGRTVTRRSSVAGPALDWPIGDLAAGTYVLAAVPANGEVRTARLLIAR
ncbi:MAG: hypothetical protein JNL05_06230 [Flavobacteriales bacterium]|nr:hypothetical protein [Flavobacteriales bacterium]